MNRRRLIQSLVALPCVGVASAAELPELPHWASWKTMQKHLSSGSWFSISIGEPDTYTNWIVLLHEFSFEKNSEPLRETLLAELERRREVVISVPDQRFCDFQKWLMQHIYQTTCVTRYNGTKVVTITQKTA